MSEVKHTAHTPGPWTISQQQGLRLFIVGNDEALAETLRCAWDDEQFANTRLIAAAPELLAALEHMVAVSNWATTIQSEEQYDAMIASAEAAIRKAKGH